MPDRYLTLAQLADRLGVPVKTLENWRYRGGGPPAHKFGRHVRFALADVERWEAAQRERRPGDAMTS